MAWILHCGRVERDSREKGKQAAQVLSVRSFVFRLAAKGSSLDHWRPGAGTLQSYFLSGVTEMKPGQLLRVGLQLKTRSLKPPSNSQPIISLGEMIRFRTHG